MNEDANTSLTKSEKNNPYTRRISDHFEAGHEHWAVTGFTDDFIEFEERWKNGIGGEANKGDDGKWTLDEYSRKQIERHGHSGKATADAVEAFFNEHGTPADV